MLEAQQTCVKESHNINMIVIKKIVNSIIRNCINLLEKTGDGTSGIWYK
jgi:hypothetical protein